MYIYIHMYMCVCVCIGPNRSHWKHVRRRIQVWLGTFVSLCLYMCVLILLYVSSCLGICVLILCLLVYRGICVLVPLYVCPHSSIYVCSLPHLYKHAGDPQDGPLGVLCGRHVCSRYEETFFFFFFYSRTRGIKYAGTSMELCGRICLACWRPARFFFSFFLLSAAVRS